MQLFEEVNSYQVNCTTFPNINKAEHLSLRQNKGNIYFSNSFPGYLLLVFTVFIIFSSCLTMSIAYLFFTYATMFKESISCDYNKNIIAFLVNVGIRPQVNSGWLISQFWNYFLLWKYETHEIYDSVYVAICCLFVMKWKSANKNHKIFS